MSNENVETNVLHKMRVTFDLQGSEEALHALSEALVQGQEEENFFNDHMAYWVGEGNIEEGHNKVGDLVLFQCSNRSLNQGDLMYLIEEMDMMSTEWDDDAIQEQLLDGVQNISQIIAMLQHATSNLSRKIYDVMIAQYRALRDMEVERILNVGIEDYNSTKPQEQDVVTDKPQPTTKTHQDPE